jgi:dTDP-4-amino-4,6-dideoxygalactose transaminase
MTWRIALSDIDLDEAEIAAVERVLRSKWLSMGPLTQEFEAAFAAFVGARHAIAVANCTVALHLAYAALGLGPGDEVIMPALTFVATANALLLTGATPIFADVRGLDDLTLDPEAVAALITPRTRAIAVMHYGGYACDMAALLALAERHGLALIEDAAHAPGGALDGRMLGTLGDVGCFSFFANKNMATGEGGMIVTDRDDLAERMRLLRSHGMTTLTWERHRGHAASYDVVAPGYNYRTDEIHAALGIEQLRKLPANNDRRAALTRHYRQALAGIPGLELPFAKHRGQPAYHLLPVVLPDAPAREHVAGVLRDARIQTSRHYPPIHRFSAYRERVGARHLPATEAAGERELTLPLHPLLSPADVDLVAATMRAALTGGERKPEQRSDHGHR